MSNHTLAVLALVAAGWASPTAAQPVSLADALERGVDAAPALMAARADRDRTQYEADAARASFAPRLDLTASYTRLSRVEQVPLNFGGMEIENPFPQFLDRYGLRASLRVPLTDYFAVILPRFRAARDTAEVTEYQYAAQRASAGLSVANAYFSLAQAEGAATVAATSLPALEAHERDVAARLEAGMATRADLLEIQAQRYAAEADVINANGQLTAARAQLANVLGRAEDQTPLETAGLLVGDVPDVETMVREGRQNRPEFLAFEALTRLHQRSRRAARGSRWPSLSLTASADYANPNPRSTIQEQTFTGSWDVGVSLAWSPNDAVARGVDVRRAEAELVRVQGDEAALENQLRAEAIRAHQDWHALGASLQSVEARLTASREAVRRASTDCRDAPRACQS